MTVDVFTSGLHLWDHLAPIWDALPDHVRGALHTYPDTPAQRSGRLLLTASYPDMTTARARPSIFLEHGTGQSYRAKQRHPSYSGGRGRERVVLNLVTNAAVAERNRAAYPDTPSVVIGAPKLAPWWDRPRPAGAPVVAYCPHWDCHLAPEARSSLPWVERHMGDLRRACTDRGWLLLGHSHPRIWDDARRVYVRHHVPHTPSLGEVFDTASVVVSDNSSAGFEAMAIGIPVVWLNPPYYSRAVTYPPRFWEWADAGVQCDDLALLPDALALALEDPPGVAERRAECVAALYPVSPQEGLRRAVEAIVALAEVWDPEAWDHRVRKEKG